LLQLKNKNKSTTNIEQRTTKQLLTKRTNYQQPNRLVFAAAYGTTLPKKNQQTPTIKPWLEKGGTEGDHGVESRFQASAAAGSLLLLFLFVAKQLPWWDFSLLLLIVSFLQRRGKSGDRGGGITPGVFGGVVAAMQGMVVVVAVAAFVIVLESC
jgi:hypothetical protein